MIDKEISDTIAKHRKLFSILLLSWRVKLHLTDEFLSFFHGYFQVSNEQQQFVDDAKCEERRTRFCPFPRPFPYTNKIEKYVKFLTNQLEEKRSSVSLSLFPSGRDGRNARVSSVCCVCETRGTERECTLANYRRRRARDVRIPLHRWHTVRCARSRSPRTASPLDQSMMSIDFSTFRNEQALRLLESR